MNVSFDTLAAARDLEAAGIERPQAEAIVKTMRESGRADFASLATKVDIAEVRTEIKVDIAEVRTEIKVDIAEVRTEIADVRTAIANLETRLLRWIVGTILTTAGVTVAIVRLLMV